MATWSFAVQGMHCASCSLLIDDVLEDLPGVLQTQTSVQGAQSVVQVDPTQVSVEHVIQAIAQAGYQAQLVSTN